MKKYYITGVSGTGKSTLIEEFKKRGLNAVDLDDGFCAWKNIETGETANVKEKTESFKGLESESLKLAKDFLGKKVVIKIDRPKNSKHLKHGFNYDENYGYIEGVIAPDGEELDAYYLGTDNSVNEAEGICIAIIHRTEDDDDKLVIAPNGVEFTNEEIEQKVKFQEQWFDHEIIR